MNKTLLILSALSACSPCLAGIVADTLFFECRGEGKAGQMAVASVIFNRAGGNSEKLKTVCLAPRQFSCWNKGYTKAKPRNKAERAILCELEALEGQMFNGTFKPSTKADHYLRFDCFPAWRKELKNQVRIGNHIFGNLK